MRPNPRNPRFAIPSIVASSAWQVEPSYRECERCWGRRELLDTVGRSHAGVLAGENLEDQKIGGMKGGNGQVIQVFIAVRDVLSDQDAKLLHRYTQLLSRLQLGVLSLVLLGWERTCVHNPIAF